MKRSTSLLGILSVFCLNVFASTSAQAVTLDTSGIWTNVEILPIDDIGTTTLQGEGTNQISWGTVGEPTPELPNPQQSSYVFEGSSQNLGDDFAGQDFILGSFTHNNFPIFAPSITGATLEVTLELSNGEVEIFNLSFLFDHFETVNFPDDLATPRVEGCAAGGIAPCPDRVRIEGDGIANETIEIDGVTYFLRIIAFLDPETGLQTREFLTDEIAANQAFLVAELTRAIPWETDLLAGSASFVVLGLIYSRYRKIKVAQG